MCYSTVHLKGVFVRLDTSADIDGDPQMVWRAVNYLFLHLDTHVSKRTRLRLRTTSEKNLIRMEHSARSFTLVTMSRGCCAFPDVPFFHRKKSFSNQDFNSLSLQPASSVFTGFNWKIIHQSFATVNESNTLWCAPRSYCDFSGELYTDNPTTNNQDMFCARNFPRCRSEIFNPILTCVDTPGLVCTCWLQGGRI